MTVPENQKKLPEDFDPFHDRQARDVRNALSELLLDCLARREVFTREADGLLGRYPQRPYSDYIRDRSGRYRKATAEARSAMNTPLTQAAILWRHELYFEAHEVLEPLWLESDGSVRDGLKGLIQAAGVWVHREAGRPGAAANLARKAIPRLRKWGHALDLQPPMEMAALLAKLENLAATFDATDRPPTQNETDKGS